MFVHLAMSIAGLCSVYKLFNTTAWPGKVGRALERRGLDLFAPQGKLPGKAVDSLLRTHEICPQ